MPEIMANIPIVSSEEAERVCHDVYAQRAQWTSRHSAYPSFTLGAASYLDARDDRFRDYQEAAQRKNPTLAASFGWLHERLREAVSRIVGDEAAYDARLALPGFHIFLYHPAFQHPIASVHYDLQYDLIDWTELGTPDGSRQLSLTVTFALPAAGGGIYVWNINRLEIEQMSGDARRAHSAANRHAKLLPYTVGNLVVHSGHQLHQIAPLRDAQSTDQRITMQAHTLPVDGRWLIYW